MDHKTVIPVTGLGSQNCDPCDRDRKTVTLVISSAQRSWLKPQITGGKLFPIQLKAMHDTCPNVGEEAPLLPKRRVMARFRAQLSCLII
jgi:hypothetical protein